MSLNFNQIDADMDEAGINLAPEALGWVEISPGVRRAIASVHRVEESVDYTNNITIPEHLLFKLVPEA